MQSGSRELEIDLAETLGLGEDVALDPVKLPGLNPFNLSSQEIIFVNTLVTSRSLVFAARTAGYEGDSSTGRKLLDKPKIRAEYQRLCKQEQTAEFDSHAMAVVKPADVLNEIWAIASTDATDAVIEQPDGTYKVKRIATMGRTMRKAIRSIRVTPRGDVQIEFYDKLAALRMVATAVGLKTGKAPRTPGDALPNDDDDDGEAPAQGKTQVPQIERSLTFEDVVGRNGERISRKVLKQTQLV